MFPGSVDDDVEAARALSPISEMSTPLIRDSFMRLWPANPRVRSLRDTLHHTSLDFDPYFLLAHVGTEVSLGRTSGIPASEETVACDTRVPGTTSAFRKALLRIILYIDDTI